MAGSETTRDAWSGLHYRRSLASRVTILTTLAVGLAVTVVAFAAFATVRSQSMHSLDESLHTRATQVVDGETVDPQSSEEVPSWALGAADVKILFYDAANDKVYGATASAARSLSRSEWRVAMGQSAWSARTVVIEGRRYRLVAVPASRGQALILAQSLFANDRMLDRLGLVMLFFGLAGMIAAGLAGWAVARNGLRPVRRLTAAVEDIARTEELTPIPVNGNDEVARLAVAFNTLLAAVSASQSRQRQLVADAGHELRTPLTSLRTNLDLLVQAGSSTALDPQARRELLDDVRGQIGEMTNLIGDLVELARDEPTSPTVEAVELAAVVSQAVVRVRRRAPGLEFAVETSPWWVHGEPAALERAITNLLDNAAKWSPPDGTVMVTLQQGTLMVADQGAGIPATDLPHVFDRFFRSAESRGMAGSGLGLSIVKAVADRHGGVVRAGSGPDGGAAFWFHVPGSMSPPEVLARS